MKAPYVYFLTQSSNSSWIISLKAGIFFKKVPNKVASIETLQWVRFSKAVRKKLSRPFVSPVFDSVEDNIISVRLVIRRGDSGLPTSRIASRGTGSPYSTSSMRLSSSITLSAFTAHFVSFLIPHITLKSNVIASAPYAAQLPWGDNYFTLRPKCVISYHLWNKIKKRRGLKGSH